MFIEIENLQEVWCGHFNLTILPWTGSQLELQSLLRLWASASFFWSFSPSQRLWAYFDPRDDGRCQGSCFQLSPFWIRILWGTIMMMMMMKIHLKCGTELAATVRVAWSCILYVCLSRYLYLKKYSLEMQEIRPKTCQEGRKCDWSIINDLYINKDYHFQYKFIIKFLRCKLPAAKCGRQQQLAAQEGLVKNGLSSCTPILMHGVC